MRGTFAGLCASSSARVFGDVKTKLWLRIAVLAAIVAAVASGVAFYAIRPVDGPLANSTAPVTLDPALVAQTSVLASAGDLAAQLQMGVWWLGDQGHPQDYRQAAEWLRQAAESGNSYAQYHLATLYQAGRGVERDFTNALSWFKKAAAQHHVAALFNLGSMYEAGQGAARDTAAAAGYFQQAAELGDAYAQYNMARRCEEGHGVARNLVEAWKWYELANAGGVPDTLHARAAIASRLSGDQLREAHRAIEEFRQRSAVSQKGSP
jgi:TPR repeat protein